MNSYVKKLTVSVIAIFLIFGIIVTTIILRSSTDVEANVSFSGISSIVASSSEAAPFNVVELTPNQSMAEIGYMVDGSEPIRWLDEISNMYNSNNGNGIANSNNIVKYVNETLKNKLSPILDKNGVQNTNLLHYEKYEERYVVKQNEISNWNVLKLTGTETIPAGQSGYKMVEVGDGVGSYIYQSNYIPQEDPTKGDYNQNVINYVYSGNGYYGLAMEAVKKEGNVTYVQMFGENGGAYKVNSATAFAKEEKLNAYIVENPTASIYRLNLENVRGEYEFVGYAGEIMGVPDFNNYVYFSVKMQYVPVAEMDESKVYYKIKDGGVRFFYQQNGEYGAVLDENNPYIKVNGNSIGNFKLDTSSLVYTYVGAGKGKYELTVSANDILDYPVNVNQIYYKGGFSNNNWFKNGVFNQDNSLSADNDIYINVDAYTPDMFSNIDVTDVDLLYLNGSASNLAGGDIASYNAENDLTWDEVLLIAKWANMPGFYMPVIVDYSIFNGTVNANSTNVQKLAALLCATNFDELNIDEQTNPSSFDWSKLKFISDSDNHYIKGNVYVIPGDSTDNVPFIFRDFTSAFLQRTNNADKFYNNYLSIGFGEIAELINQENLIRQTENNAGKNYEYYDLYISKAIAIEYAICYSSKRSLAIDDTLNILDIEPCAPDPAKADSKILRYDNVKEWLGNNAPSRDKVKITTMSSAEFIGKIEDLNTYDIIYFGLCSDRLNTDTSGATVYNDTNMNGMYYTNIGDLIVIKPDPVPDPNNHDIGNDERRGHVGLLDNDYNSNKTGLNYDSISTPITYESLHTYRGSGNDITDEKVNKLEAFIKAGNPIILHDSFVNNDNTINSHIVDNSSKIFDFFNNNINSQYVMSSSQARINSSTLNNYLTISKPKIIYQETGKKAQGVDLDKSNWYGFSYTDYDYIELDSNVIKLDFNIDNSGGVDVNALFGVKLVLDSNADGKFSLTQETIAGNEIRLYQNGSIIEPKHRVIEDKEEYYYEVPAGSQYKYNLVYTLPDSYVGIIPWKLVVNQSTNEYRYDSVQGYFYRPRTESTREKIKILQINTENLSVGSTYNMQDEYNKESWFSKLLSQVNDYELEIRTVSAAEYEQNYRKLDSDNPVKESGKIYLEDYDMLIMGFGDCYDITDVNGCVLGIKEYIEAGNPILFTHDTTSFFNDDTRTVKKSNSKYVWGYDFNKIVRGVVGMDRYGILSNEYIKKGNNINNATNKTEYDNAIKTSEESHKDIAYLPGSNKQIITRQSQGFTNYDLNARMNKEYTNYTFFNGLSKGYNGQGWSDKGYNGSWNDVDGWYISQVNSGQITNYPFKLPDSFLAELTHMQYYQLDLNQDADADGESDIVVWYTLGNENSQYYNLSLKDIRNNYYIYTMGNVTYSGVGHRRISDNSYEQALYINTMIAAYNAGVRAPSIELKENDSIDSPNLGTVYVSVDDVLNQQIEGENAVETIYFKVTDTNYIRYKHNKNLYSDFYVEISESEYQNISSKDDRKVIDRDGKLVYLKKLDVNPTVADDDSAYNYVSTKARANGVLYKVDIPLDILGNNKNYVDVYCIANTEIVKLSNSGYEVSRTLTNDSYESFRVQRVTLQDLD